jgi:energy-coupling factor transporter ATP-binding protein EcfA2/AAA+ ATPase superfamily predicted ATPase
MNAFRVAIERQPPKRYALVIGINKYDSIPNLRYATSDAEAVAQVLEQHGNFEVERLPKCCNEEKGSDEVADERLTGRDLGHTLKQFLFEKAKYSDALIYYTGHGGTALNNLEEEQGYLITSDYTPETVQSCCIALSSFNDLVRKADLNSLVVILDTCHAGFVIEDYLVRQTLNVFQSKVDYYLMASCNRSGYSYEGEKFGGGVFTQALLKGLSKNNAGSDGQVSVDRLFDFAAGELRNLFSRQEPIRMGSGQTIHLVRYQDKQTPSVADETCPYQGLEPFKDSQEKFFFGRLQLINLLQQKLKEVNFVPIIGASGSGKSSVVRAGLITRLKQTGWRVLEPILPGVDPLGKFKQTFTQLFEQVEQQREVSALIDNSADLRSLIEKLPGTERFLLVVDQFEEVFTVCPKEKEADKYKFIELLTQVAKISASRLAIIITMRADFLEPCLDYPLLNQLIQKHLLLIPPLRGADLQQAIEEPAKIQGYELESGLLAEIIQDVGQEKGCLPLLQFALTQLWEQRDQISKELLLQQYKQMGGVIGALNSHAEEIYQSLTAQQQDWVKRIFLKLVHTNLNGKDTRQRQPKSKLLALAGNSSEQRQSFETILDELIKGRLLVIGQELTGEVWVDLAHEALMDGWERFENWRHEDRELRQLITELEREWKYWLDAPLDEKDNHLMNPGRLARVRKRWSELEVYLPETGEFYKRSEAFAQKKVAEETSRKIKLKELEARSLEMAVEFLELADAKTNREGEQILKIVSIPGRLSYSTPLPVLLAVDTLTDQNVNELFHHSEQLEGNRSQKAGILLYREPPDALFRTQMATVRLRNNFILIPIPLAAVEQVLLDRESANKCKGLLAEYADRYLPGSNLFDDRNAIGDTLSFFGRSEILHSLQGDLQRNQSIGLFGLRKSGKTSLLLQLRFALRQHPVVHIDFQFYGNKSHYGTEVFNEILQQLSKLLGSRTPDSTSQTQLLSLENSAAESTSEFARQVRDLAKNLSKAGYELPILCFFDEIERILPSKEDSKERIEEFNALFSALRALSQEQRQLNILVVDVHPDCNRINHWSQKVVQTNPVCQFFKEVFVSPFSVEDTTTMLTDIGELMGLKFDENTLETIHRLSGGHPFIARQLASCLHKKIRPEGDGLITMSAAQRYLNKPFSYSDVLKNYFGQNIWADLEIRNLKFARAALQLLACNEESEDSIVTQRVLQERLKNEFNDFSESDCLDVLLLLENFGLVNRKEAEDDEYYQIQVGLLSRWLRMYKG